ncbi:MULTISPECIES: hypothetical protein [Elizabethkingia]|uniref:hypothetical protein n=1 Tax=Elizabethkingia TaxID=308865 RepID=UPI00063BE7B7|nr:MULTISPECIES: hypothetical protein [Elizabethkingia]AKH95368.1 hypothetical protein M876_12405 [Elizabethkingia anophelis FMS-007]MCL1656695.1 hypothetical protein [Elizabethkingia miricola]MCL1671553.1 hypothetical protein [Elizabethkingia ursingii]MCL1680766.1 hypothetical protein [Elizabethkingia miricola]MCT3650385.1 hypothetical protein [Elizabethkingia anophelis]
MKKLSKKDLKVIKGSGERGQCHTSNDCRPGGNYACCFGVCQKTTEMEYLPECTEF